MQANPNEAPIYYPLVDLVACGMVTGQVIGWLYLIFMELTHNHIPDTPKYISGHLSKYHVDPPMGRSFTPIQNLPPFPIRRPVPVQWICRSRVHMGALDPKLAFTTIKQKWWS